MPDFSLPPDLLLVFPPPNQATDTASASVLVSVPSVATSACSNFSLRPRQQLGPSRVPFPHDPMLFEALVAGTEIAQFFPASGSASARNLGIKAVGPDSICFAHAGKNTHSHHSAAEFLIDSTDKVAAKNQVPQKSFSQALAGSTSSSKKTL